uniref:Uncharacterized protein n=1 Tax=Faecalibaculum rodentium TaxID=1702221 RepID=A0A140DWT9_9FIRM|nr:hypothetical protein AALO17_19820 [Faecalibaculum rodentium]
MREDRMRASYAGFQTLDTGRRDSQKRMRPRIWHSSFF